MSSSHPKTRLAGLFHGDGLKARSIRSTFWAGSGQISGNVIRLVGNLILTRLLFPEAFGLMALVQVVIGGLQMFSDLGIRTSIVQDDKGDDPLFLDTAWMLQILRGVLLWLGVFALAGPAANFYDAPMLAQLLPVAALVVIIDGFASTKIASQERHLKLGAPILIGLGSQVLGLVVMVAAAFITGSIWSLVAGSLVTSTARSLGSHWLLTGDRNRFRMDWSSVGSIFHFGKYIFLASIAGFLANHGDRAILGKFVPLDDLAFYNIGYFLGSVPVLLAMTTNQKVLFPLIRTQKSADPEARQRSLFKARALLQTGLLAMSAGLAVVGNLLTILLYAPPFEQSGPLLVMIAVAQMPTVMITCYGSFMLAHGDSARFAVYVAALSVIKTILLLLGAMYFGVIGVAAAPFLAALLVYPIAVRMTRRYDSWLPGLDAAHFAFIFASGAFAFWLNQNAIAASLDRFLPG